MTTDVDDVDLVTTVDVGDTVDWTWVGGLPHTTTACSGSDFATCDQSQGWDSGIQTSGTFSFTFTQPATFYYRCNVHPDQMRGQITVVAPAEPSPSPQPTPQASPQASPEASPQPTPQASPEASPQPSPQASLQASPEASPQPSPQPITPTPAGLQAMAVPAGGGAPPDAGGSSMLWWLAVAAGALLVVSAVVLVSRLPRH
jgi:hypothetical protein